MPELAPIVVFVYNRPDHTRQTLEALSKNELADKSELFIYADGPKENASPEILEKIKQVRSIAHEKQWCKTVTVIESEKNKGLADSIISGVTEIVNKYGRVIVLEDDIVTGKHFLDFMNTALEKYENEKQVYHITGFRNPIKGVSNDSAYFYPNMDCWSWATWSDRWKDFKKNAQYYKSIFTPKMIWKFNIEGTESGNWQQIEDNLSGKINTWAIFWEASIFLKNGLCLGPTKSLVKNVGFDNSGVHCGENKSQTILDDIDNKVINFPDDIIVNRFEFEKNKLFFKKLHYVVWYKKIYNKLGSIGKRIVMLFVKIIKKIVYRFVKKEKEKK